MAITHVFKHTFIVVTGENINALILFVPAHRHLVEPLVQRQPEAEAGQRDSARADGEDPDPRVQLGKHLAVSVGGRDLLQHHRLPQVPHTLH